MNYLAAQEIKRRGISAVDEAMANGPVHLIKNNQPQYVVLTEAAYNELVDALAQGTVTLIRASLEDAAAGRVTRHDSVEELLGHLSRNDP